MFVFLLFSALIHGRVYDKETGDPLFPVNVYTHDRSTGTTTDKNGYYRLQLKEGRYKIYFSIVGYRTVEKEIKLKKGEAKVVDIGMRMEPLKMKEITVRAQKQEFKEIPGIRSAVLYEREIRTIPSFLEEDILRTFSMLPGVTQAADFSTGLFVRGAGCDANLFLLDGVQLFNMQHFGGVVSIFDADMVKKGELVLSGIPAEYDGRLSAVVNIKTKPGSRKKHSLNLSLSTLSAKASGDGPFLFGSTYAFSIRRTYLDKLFSIFSKEYVFPYYFYDVYMKIGKDLENSHTFLTCFLNQDIFYYTTEDVDVSFTWSNRVLALNHFQKIQKNSMLHFVIGNTWFLMNADIADSFIVVKNRIASPSLKLSFEYPTERHRIKIGTDFETDDINYSYRVQDGMNFFLSAVTQSFGIYAEDMIEIEDKALFTPGLRVNLFYSREQKKSGGSFYIRPSPRLSFKYFLNEITAVVLSAGIFNQFLVATVSEEDYLAPFLVLWLPAGKKYGPPNALHLNFGVEGWLGEGTSYFAELYYRKYNDILIMQENEKIDIEDLWGTLFKEPGEGNAWGVDVLLKKITGRFTGWISYSLMFSEVCFEGKRYPPVWDRRHNFKGVLLFDFGKGIRMGIETSFASGNPYTGVMARYRRWYYDMVNDTLGFYWIEVPAKKNSMRYPAYFRTDLSLIKEFSIFGKDGEIKVSIINVTNRKNVFFYYYDYEKEPPVRKEITMLPIFPSCGIKIRF